MATVCLLLMLATTMAYVSALPHLSPEAYEGYELVIKFTSSVRLLRPKLHMLRFVLDVLYNVLYNTSATNPKHIQQIRNKLCNSFTNNHIHQQIHNIFTFQAEASISLHGWGDTQWPINPPPTTVLLSCDVLLRTTYLLYGMKSYYEMVIFVRLGDRVPTTPCTSRLKAKKTKNSFNLSRKYCMDKK